MITLLTDFGFADTYVGVMKGVIAQINRQVPVVDLCHQIAPQDIRQASFHLAAAYHHFPKGTIHVAVVDPGVGGRRAAIALDLGTYVLVGPNNGIFSQVLSGNSARFAVCLDRPDYWYRHQPSSTFHGRDIFAAAAAYISQGVPLIDLGKPFALTDLVQFEASWHPTQAGGNGIIQAIDHFGTLISTIPDTALPPQRDGSSWLVQYKGQQIAGHSTYSDVALQAPLALVGGHGWVEIAINQGNAQQAFQASIGESITLICRP